MQRFTIETFMQRYGKTDYKETDFAKVLSNVPDLSKDGPWLAGGAVRRLITGIPQDGDFDFFFRNEDQMKTFCAELEKEGAKKVSENSFNVTYLLPVKDGRSEIKIQAVFFAYYGDIEEVILSFDFSICQFGFDGDSVVAGDWSLFDLANKRLVPEKIKFATSSVRRIIKYTRQGYTICSGGISAILRQVAEDPEIIHNKIEYID